MPRGKLLTEHERGAIDALNKQGLSKRGIAREIGRSEHVVRNYLKDRENYGCRSYPGRKKALGQRDMRKITRLASNSTVSLAQIKDKCNISAHKSTISRALKRNPNIVRQIMQKAPRLDEHHKASRLVFARVHITQNWNKVLIHFFLIIGFFINLFYFFYF